MNPPDYTKYSISELFQALNGIDQDVITSYSIHYTKLYDADRVALLARFLATCDQVESLYLPAVIAP